MNYNINANNITLPNGYSLDFEYPIKDTLLIENVIIILVNTPVGKIYNQNVFAISTSGDFLWRIGQVKLYFNNSNDCPYVGMSFDDNDLILFNWCDTCVIVNPLNGDIIRTYQTK